MSRPFVKTNYGRPPSLYQFQWLMRGTYVAWTHVALLFLGENLVLVTDLSYIMEAK